MIYNIIHGNPYQTRRGNGLSLPKVKTELHRHSFKNQAIREWKALPNNLRQLDTRLAFKNKLRPKPSVDLYYQIENTSRSAINLARLRCGNANLNENLHCRNFKDSPICQCGQGNESTAHYLLHCPIYNRARDDARRVLPPRSLEH